MEQKKLTERQLDVLNFIKKYVATHGYPPAIREISNGLDLKSPATAFSHIKSLEKKGYLKSENNKFRTLEVIGENEYITSNDNITKIPLLGKITAGNPITAIEQPKEYFDLPSNLIPYNSEAFILEVSGDSMINKGIYDGDYIIVKRQNTAKNGDIVVAMTMDDEVTLKTFYKEKGYFRLQPENDTMEPFVFRDITILGIAIGLYRKI